MILIFECVCKPTHSGLVKHTVQTNPPLSRMKTLNGRRVRRISPVGKEKVYGGKDLLESQVFSSERQHERVREDESGDSDDGEDKLSCMIGGEREGDSI